MLIKINLPCCLANEIQKHIVIDILQLLLVMHLGRKHFCTKIKEQLLSLVLSDNYIYYFTSTVISPCLISD